jgi:hypothetical protein
MSGGTWKLLFLVEIAHTNDHGDGGAPAAQPVTRPSSSMSSMMQRVPGGCPKITNSRNCSSCQSANPYRARTQYRLPRPDYAFYGADLTNNETCRIEVGSCRRNGRNG